DPENDVLDGRRSRRGAVIVRRIESRDVVDRAPAFAGVCGRVDRAGRGDVDQAREVFGALDVARHPVQRFGYAAEHQSGRIQVSFEPPPCEEFTTSDPSVSATRVNAAAGTSTWSPQSSAYGRRSTWRGAIPSAVTVGCAESVTT